MYHLSTILFRVFSKKAPVGDGGFEVTGAKENANFSIDRLTTKSIHLPKEKAPVHWRLWL